MGMRYERAYFGHGPAIVEGADRQVEAFLAGRRPRREPASRPLSKI
jgi:hypothetical protein